MEDIGMPVQGPLIWAFLVFSILMLLDAIARKAGWFWYIVILAAPLGAVIYFVAVMIPSLSRSRERARTGESADGRARTRLNLAASDLDRADHLEATEQYNDAVPIYADVLEHEPNNLRALHGMARCELGIGHPRVAVELLERVLVADREFANFGAALDYADALWLAGQQKDTVDLLRGLVEVTGRINHRLALAHYLAEGGDTAAAKTEVERAITAHASLPAEEQARQKHWLDRAVHMLEQW